MKEKEVKRMRLVDADKVIENIKKVAQCETCEDLGGVRCRACEWKDAMDLIDDFADNRPWGGIPENEQCKTD